MNKMLRHTLMATAVLSLAGTALNALAADGDGKGNGWDWTVAPYAWGASVRTDLHTARAPSADLSSDTSFSDVVDKLDGAFQIHIEGRGDQFGIFTDFTYLGLASEQARPRFRTESDLDTRLFELAGVWIPGAERDRGWNVFAGLRYVDADLNVHIEPVNPLFAPATVHSSRTYSDFMAGARYTWRLSERWSLTLRGDASVGETKGTWNASTVTQYRTDYGAWMFGYRYLSMKLGDGGNEAKITMNGPWVGFGFKF